MIDYNVDAKLVSVMISVLMRRYSTFLPKKFSFTSIK